MDVLQGVGYFCLVLTGVSLGLLGAGGSILAVPILVFMLSVTPVRATGYSLVIVGATALVGAFQFIRRGYAHPRMAAVLGVPAIMGAYLSRRVVFPSVPDPAFHLGTHAVAKDTLVMVLFAAFITVAAAQMVRGRKRIDTDEFRPHRFVPAWVIAVLGFGVGVFAGFVGAGGGFMILPVLVLLGGLPMRMAIGTSLLVIAAQSLVGFVGEIQAVHSIDYRFAAEIVVPPLCGIYAGTWLNKKAPAAGLRTAFGWFLFLVAAAIVAEELWLV